MAVVMANKKTIWLRKCGLNLTGGKPVG